MVFIQYMAIVGMVKERAVAPAPIKKNVFTTENYLKSL